MSNVKDRGREGFRKEAERIKVKWIVFREVKATDNGKEKQEMKGRDKEKKYRYDKHEDTKYSGREKEGKKVRDERRIGKGNRDTEVCNHKNIIYYENRIYIH